MSASLATLLLLAKAAAPIHEPRTYIASIEGIQLGKNEYVDGFSIETWGVEFKAVCHIPPGWRIRAGSSASPDGTLEGEASHGVTFLDQKRIGQLKTLVLLQLVAPVLREDRIFQNGKEPATFSGKASIGTYGEDEGREAKLTYRNVALTPAKQCPAPRP